MKRTGVGGKAVLQEPLIPFTIHSLSFILTRDAQCDANQLDKEVMAQNPHPAHNVSITCECFVRAPSRLIPFLILSLTANVCKPPATISLQQQSLKGMTPTFVGNKDL